jgi:hypothetical protein
VNEETYDLKELAQQLTEEFPQITALHLFGSRRYRTRSPRSDVDILVQHSDHIRPNSLRLFCDKYCPALDLFIVDTGKAVSCSNESYVQANSFDELIASLGAIQFWSKADGILAADIDWTFSVPVGVEFVPTAVMMSEPFSFKWVASMRGYFRHLEREGLPTSPYIGSSALEIAVYFKELIKRLVAASSELNPKGNGWEVKLVNEYDFQNLFFLSVKPWLPGLAREEVTITYDNQSKTADFNLFYSQIVVELKHIRDSNTKAAVGKTLEGLASFYTRHPNIRVLIFAILVARDVDLDDAKWESDFSYPNNEPAVMTIVVRQPA